MLLSRHTRRREFVTLLGGAAAWPLAAQAQQPTIPVIGLLSPRASGDVPQLIAAVRQGLKDLGYIEGQNVTIEYRFAEHQNERLAVALLGSATAWSLSFCAPSLLRGGCYDTNADRAVYTANNDLPFVGPS